MNTLSPTERTHLLNVLLAHFTSRVQQFLDYLDHHPAAALAELEAQAQYLSADCFAPALQAGVAHRRVAVEANAAAQPTPCGHPGHYKGVAPRTLLTRVGPITFRRAYYYCARCRQGHYPLDAALGLGTGQFSEGVQQGVCQLAAELPFERAASTWTALSGLPISPREVARLSETRGQQLEAHLHARQAALLAGDDANPADPHPPRTLQPTGAGIWAVALDAARICFRDDWHEVKAGVVFWAQHRPAADPTAGPWDGAEARAQSYVAVAGAMPAAGARLYLEAMRRGIAVSEQRVVCLGDGAPGNWEQFATHFPHRVEVLDWFHAVEHLWAAGKGLYGAETEAAAAWVGARKAELWAGRVAAVQAALAQAAETEATGAAARQQIGYFTTNAARMDYAAYRAAGYPIGSGTVESACKRVIGARAKGGGMRWSHAGVQGVLTLRAELLSGRWQQSWPATTPARQAA